MAMASSIAILREFSDEAEDDEELFFMANLTQEDTGLPMIVWASQRGKAQHGPRLKVSTHHGTHFDPYDTVSVTISDNPIIVAGTGLSLADLRLVQKFIQVNYKLLMDYWQGGMSTKQFVNSIVLI